MKKTDIIAILKFDDI